MADDGNAERLAQALRKSVKDAKRLQQINRELLAARSEPIAIVGIGCRFPEADDPDALWELLARGADLVGDFPADRGWDAQALYDPDPDARGKVTSCRGAFLRDAAMFDAGFFGISPREALSIDPQQRILLEICWESLERAGIDPRSLRGSATGVFVGLWQSQYGLLPMPPELEGFIGIGNVPCIASGRIAYSLGVHGPALTVDTACSSSLVGVHLACQSLRQGECDLALAGGVTVMATPMTFVEFSRQRGLAPDGRCKSFAATADGTGWGEGAAVLALERLSDARRHGHPILALVRGSAVNQDGKSQGLKAPNGPAQEQVIRQALASARLTAADVDAVEGHGTGTVLGDPIEAQALIATYGAEHTRERPLWLGSLKSNLGHTQAAAGVAGLIKMVLAFAHEQLPKSLYTEQASQHVDWSSGSVQLLRDAVPWPAGERPRRAGVSSFGMSGTNAHVIVEEAPPPEAAAAAALAGPSVQALAPQSFLLSARSDAALRGQAGRLHAHLRAHPDLALSDLAFSLATTRTAFERRAVVIARERSELLDALAQLSAAEPAAAVVAAQAGYCSGLAVLFTGQGSQRPQMGLSLYRNWPVFQRELDAIFAGFAGELDVPLPDVMFAPAGSERARLLDQTAYAQPALFALEVALYRWLEQCGVRPRYLLGHSIGELAAAHVAQVMSLADACRVVSARGRLMQALPEGGAMLAIEASEDELVPHLAAQRDVDLAAVNGERAVVVSGDEAAVQALARTFESEGRRTRRLEVSHAFHSARMEPMLEEYARVLRGIALRPARLAIASNVSGVVPDAAVFSTPEYWVKQVRAAVRFHPALRALESEGASGYLELGPHGVLSALAQRSQLGGAPAWAALRAGRDEDETLLRALAGLHVTGHAMDFRALYAAQGGKRIGLPTYAFQRERYWPAVDGVLALPTSQHVQHGSAAELLEAPAALRKRLLPQNEPERQETLLELVRETFNRVTASHNLELDVDQPLQELGLDSLMAIELQNQLAQRSGLSLSKTLLFDYPTARKLARQLHEQLFGSACSSALQPIAAVDSAEPIAIVGMACRYPGGVDGPDALWQLVARGGDAIAEFPSDRGWDLDALYDPDPDRSGKSSVRHGGFVAGVPEFDAGFFGISPREALATDPQQRLLLETSWEALEHAAIDPRSLAESSTGVFLGLSQSGYIEVAMGIWTELEGHLSIGNAGSVASGRIAYALGLEGPALTIDTACSSSLVALHLACQGLRHGECALALAGGATVLATPYTFIEFSRQRALAGDGRCKAFSDAADGTGWAEGVGVVVLERHSDALRNGHPVLALIRGSAINQDGRSQGLTAPNGPAQQRVIRQALASAQLTAADIDVLEAHGTGTRLGDPIEAEALRATYGAEHTPEHPLWLGSLKSNLGHTQAAAGVGGVIKMVLALQHELLPRTLHAEQPSRYIDWSSRTMRLLHAEEPWPRGALPRRAGISAFGMSGTNAHLILEEAPQPAPVEAGARTSTGAPLPFAISARNEAALAGQAARLRAHLEMHPALELVDVAHSLLTTRTSFERRAVIVAADRAELLSGLMDVTEARVTARVALGRVAPARAPVFVFSGFGSPWLEGVLAFAESSEVFGNELRACAAELELPLLDWFAQGGEASGREAARFALMVSLAAVWRSLGVEPAAVVGYGSGEIAAAYVAGVLTRADAARVLLARRSSGLARALEVGTLNVPLGAAEVSTRLVRYEGELTLAGALGPQTSLVSGSPVRLREFAAELAREQIRACLSREQKHADSFSDSADSTEPALRDALAALRPSAAVLPLYASTRSGRLLGPELGADYWIHHARACGRFDERSAELLAAGERTFVVFGGQPRLLRALRASARAARSEAVVVPSTRSGRVGLAPIVRSLAALYARGVSVDLTHLTAGGRAVGLPTYAFVRKRYWPDASRVLQQFQQGAAPAARAQAATGTPLERVVGELSGVLRVEPSNIDPDADLSELGLDSLLALDLRQRLAAAFGGIELSTSVLFEQRSARALARELSKRERRPAAGGGNTPLLTLLRDAVRADRSWAWQLLDLAARTRRAREVEDAALESRLVWLRRGPRALPAIVCLPSLIPPAGPAQYMRFAAAFSRARQVGVLTLPGWADGERLPRDRTELVSCLASVLLERLDSRPFVLCGFSSAGWVAHALAEHLEQSEVAPTAVILLDTHVLSPDDFRVDPATALSPVRAVVHLPGETVLPDPACDAELTALVEYLQMFADYQPAEVRAATLLLSCARTQPDGFALPGAIRFGAWHDLATVDAHHRSVLLEDAPQTVEALESWLGVADYPDGGIPTYPLRDPTGQLVAYSASTGRS